MTSNPIAHLSPDTSRSDQLLADHLHNVSGLASQFSPLYPSVGKLIGLCHDLGKSSIDFQRHILNQDHRSVDHSTAGAQYLNLTEGKDWKQADMQKAYMYPLTLPIVSHHGGLRDVGTKYDSGDSPTLFGRLNKEIPDYNVPEDLKAQIHELYEASHSELTTAYLKHFRDDLKDTSLELRLKYLLSALVDADWTDTKDYFENTVSARVSRSEKDDVFDQILSYINKKKSRAGINRYRSEILEYALKAGQNDPGIYSLTAPTGSGKTRSSLGFAATHAIEHQKDRIIYVVPYNTVSDQYYTELSDEMGLNDFVLEHTSSFDSCDDDKYRELTSNWDSPIIVTSAVQFFETLAAAKTSKLRKLHNIANSVIIFDEVQNFPLPYSRYLLKMLRCLVDDFGCTILMMSATMMVFDPVDEGFKPTEILPDPQKYADIFSRSLLDDGPRVVKQDLGNVIYQDLVDHMTRYQSSICIVNRRKTAKELHKLLKDNVDLEASSYCLTKDQHVLDRKRIINQIVEDLKSGKKCYVVSTSLIEAGIDISAECVLREFAGLESIIQSAGRCNRNGEFAHGYFGVFELENTSPPRYLTTRYGLSKIIYESYNDPFSLEAIHGYFNRLLCHSNKDKKSILKLQKKMDYPEIARRMKIVDQNMVSVVVPDSSINDEVNHLRDNHADRNDLLKISQYAVDLPEYVIADHECLFEAINDSMYVLLDSNYYTPEIGLNLNQEISYII